MQSHVRIEENGQKVRIRNRDHRVWRIFPSKLPLPSHERHFKTEQPHWKATYGIVKLVCEECHSQTIHSETCSIGRQKSSGKIPKKDSKTRSLKQMWNQNDNNHEEEEEAVSDVEDHPGESQPVSVTSSVPAVSSQQSDSHGTVDAVADEADEFDDDDPGFCDKGDLIIASTPYVDEVCEEMIGKKLPRTYAGQVVASDQGWKKKANCFSPRVPFPSIEELTWNPFWDRYKYSACALAFSKCKLEVLDYESFHPGLPANFPFCKCQEGLPRD